MKNRKSKDEILASTMSVQANDQAVQESILMKVPTLEELQAEKAAKKTQATSFRFPISFISRLDAFQRSNELNPNRISKTKIVMQAVDEFIERHQAD